VAVSALAYAAALGSPSLTATAWLLAQWLAHLWLLGAAVASATWAVANHWLRGSAGPHGVDQEVEWLYAWDVHCNAFWLLFLLLHVAQFLLLPLLLSHAWLARVAGVALYAGAAAAYTLTTVAGFVALPFVRRAHLLLYALVPVALAALGALLAGVHVPRAVLGLYFHLDA
jgi:hypothetical protein